MNGAPACVDAALGELGAALAAAPDGKLARIVAALEGAAPEASADRGVAETLIGPLRPRLARVQPPRQLTLSRLAFRPLDPVIVPPARWARDSLAVPRTILAPLWTTIRAGLAGDAVTLRARLAAAPESAPAHLGAMLWPRAAAILRKAPPPAGWREATGFDHAAYAALASRVAAILAQAPALVAMETALAGGTPPSEGELASWLAPLAAAPVPTLATGIAILLARLPRAEAVMVLVEEPPRFLRIDRQDALAAVEAAVGFALDAAANVRAGGAAGADAARQVALLLLGLEARALDRPARLARIRAARQAADARLRAAFAEAVASQLTASSANAQPSAAREATARALRRFAGAARHLGSADAYDTAIREAASALAPAPGAGAVTRLARARLVKILAGSEAAAALLAAWSKDG